MSREMSRIWWSFLILGIAWIWYGMFVLPYRVGSLARWLRWSAGPSCSAASVGWWWPASERS